MTARFITTFGALALGLAAFSAAPAFAAGGNVPSTTATTTNAGEGHPGPDANATNDSNAGTVGHLGQSLVRPMHHGRMASNHRSMHSKGHMASSDGDTAAGDAAIARLNEQSLMAAQKGTNYTPSAAQ